MITGAMTSMPWTSSVGSAIGVRSEAAMSSACTAGSPPGGSRMTRYRAGPIRGSKVSLPTRTESRGGSVSALSRSNEVNGSVRTVSEAKSTRPGDP